MEAPAGAAASHAPNYNEPGRVVRFGNEETEDAYKQSGCSNLTDFISSNNWSMIELRHAFSDFDPHYSAQVLLFWLSGVRKLEEEREAGSFLRFLRALPASCTWLVCLSDLEFESEDEVSALWQAIASPLCTLKSLTASGQLFIASPCTSSAPVVVKHVIAEALLHNTSLQALEIASHLCCEEKFAQALSSRSTASSVYSLDSLGISWNVELDTSDGCGLVLGGILTGLANNTISLHRLWISASNSVDLPRAVERQLGEMLVTNASLTSLDLQGLRLSGEAVVLLFTSLENNLSLTSLSLLCQGEGWPSMSTVLDSLRVNGIITELYLRGTPVQAEKYEGGAIKAQLAKNRANVEHLKVLRQHGAAASHDDDDDDEVQHEQQLVQPTTVRLFLCGLPYSGKTTLSRSLAAWSTSPPRSSLTSKMLSHMAKFRTPKERTRGIEVTNLEKDGVKISLWDLAGQREFYSFHDYMLPNLTDEATPSIFLFVWSPIQVDPSTGKTFKSHQLEKDTIERFKDEFKYWLMFLASKTIKSVKFRPKVLVAITRADKIEQTGFSKSWVELIFRQCQEEFKDHLLLDIDGVFEVDARYPHTVKQLALHVFDGANSLLKVVPPVYKLCDDARRLVNEMIDIKPLMTKDAFFNLCHRRLGIDTIEMKEAIAHSLNNSGHLIYFKSALLVVVDVKRFCHQIMGSLLHFGMQSKNKHHERGIFPLRCLEELLEEEANSKSTARGKHRKSIRLPITTRPNKSLAMQPKIKGEDLVKVLIELGLGCQIDGGPGVFIPSSLCTGHHGSQIQPRDYLNYDRKAILTYMGRRLRCKNNVCTFFTPGFFPALQVIFHDMYSGSVTLKEDVIVFAHRGAQALMEFCHQEGESQFIDILVQSHLDFDNTIEWISEEILGKVEKVCLSPRGLQGVELAHEVIRPACVESCMCLDDRKTQVVSLEKLRVSLKSTLQKAGSLFKLEDCLKNAFHSWADGIVSNVDPIIDLLGNEETQKIVDSFRQEFVMDVNDALGINIERDMCIEKEQKYPIFSSTPSGKQIGVVFNEVREVRKDIQVVRKDIQELRKDLQKILNEMESIRIVVLPKVQQRMEELLRFSKEEEIGRLPRIPVVTKCEGKLHKIISAMVPGLQNVRLQLLCEHGQPHLVASQCGLNFATLEDGLLKRGLPYIITVLKVARVAMRVGAHVAAGLGDVVPDFTRVLALVEDTPKGLPAYTPPDSPFRDSSSRTSFQEGQQWLRDVLYKHNCSSRPRIHEVFGLTCVRYPDLRIGWLCDEHRSEYEIWIQ